MAGLVLAVIGAPSHGAEVEVLRSDQASIRLLIRPSVDDRVWNGWVGLPPGASVEEVSVRTQGRVRPVPWELGREVTTSPQITVGPVGFIRFHRACPLRVETGMATQDGVAGIPEVLLVEILLSPGSAKARKRNVGFQNVLSNLFVNWQSAQHWAEQMDGPPLPPPVPAPSIRIRVREEGLYRITAEDLPDMPGDADPRMFSLWNRGSYVPLRVVVQQPDTVWKDGDWIEFYAHGTRREDPQGRWTPVESKYGLDNPYYLVWDQVDPPRILDVSSEPTGGPAATYHWWVCHREVNTNSSLSGHEGAIDDEWYWGGQLGPGQISKQFSLPDLAREVADGVIRARFQSMSLSESEMHLLVNGAMVAEGSWNGFGAQLLEGQGVPLDVGTNQLVMDFSGDAYSRVHLDWFAIQYPREYVMSGGQAAFGPSADDRPEYEISGLEPGTKTDIFEISSGLRFMDFHHEADQEGAIRFRANLPDSATFLVVTNSGWLTSLDLPDMPTWIEPHPAVADEDREGSYLIVYPSDFLEAASGLRDHHLDAGDIESAEMVDVRHIWEEFSYGLPDPRALRSFLQWTLANWSDPPEFVLLFGDGTWDYNGYMNQHASVNLVPSYGNPASDNFYASLNDTSYFPDLHVGRVPAVDATQAWNAFQKIRNYRASPEPSLWRKLVLFVNGGGTQDEFDYFAAWTSITSQLVVAPPPVLGATSIIAKDQEEYWMGYYNKSIAAAVDSGCLIMNFFGHAATQTWDFMFESDDVDSLLNGDRTPLVLSPTCFTGDFADPRQVVFAEHFLRLDEPEHGAIGFFGSSGTAYQNKGGVYAYRIMESIFCKGDPRVGPAITWAKLNGYPYTSPEDSIMATVFSLLGDPLLSLVLPEAPDLHIGPERVTVQPEEPAVGDSVRLLVSVLNEGVSWEDEYRVTVHCEGQELASGFARADSLENRLSLSWPAPAQPGSQEIEIHVDPDQSVEEEDREDNTTALTITYLKRRPVVLLPLSDAMVPGALAEFFITAVSTQPHGFQIALCDTFGSSVIDSSGPVSPEAGLVSWTWSSPSPGTYCWRARGQGGAWSFPRWFTTGVEAAGWGQFLPAQLTGGVMEDCEVTDLGLGLYARVNISRDFALLSEGATVPEVSTHNPDACGPENLIGGQVGNTDWGGSFYFRRLDENQYAVVDLGEPRMIIKIASAHEGDTLTDRSVWSHFGIESSLNDVDYKLWGNTPDYSDSGYGPWISSNMAYEKPYPISVRYIKFSYGQCHPIGTIRPGSRVYEVYAYAALYPDSGSVFSPPLGPSDQWGRLTALGDVPGGTNTTIEVYLEDENGTWELGRTMSLGADQALDWIGDEYRRVKLRGVLTSESMDVTPRLMSWSVEYRSIPDLATMHDTLLVVPELPEPGSTAQIRAIVINAGSEPVSGASYRLDAQLDDDAPTTLESGVLGWLTPGLPESLSTPWVAEGGVTRFTLVLDPDEKITEAWEENNTVYGEARVLGNLAWIDSIEVSPPVPSPRESLSVEAWVVNNGVLALGESWARCFWVGSDSGEIVAIPPLARDERARLIWSMVAPDSVGSYQLACELDPDSLVREAWEDDNIILLPIEVVQGPDPALFDVDVYCVTPAVGDPVEVVLGLTNFGGRDTEEFLVLGLEQGVWRDSLFIDGLAGAESTVVSLWWPTGDAARSHFLEFHVDPDSFVVDCDRANNVLTMELITVLLPDLYAAGDSTWPAFPIAGDPMTLHTEVRNRGIVPAGGFEVSVQWPDGEQETQRVDSLGGQETVQFQWDWIPETSGSGSVIMTIDSAGEVGEACETNNETAIQLQIGQPWDLAVASTDIQKQDPTASFVAWDSLFLHIIVHNVGDEASPSVPVELFDGIPESDGTLLKAEDMALAAGASDTLEAVWPEGAFPGTHLLVAVLNRQNEIEEFNTSNNRASREVVVLGDTIPPGVAVRPPWPGFAQGGFLAQGDTITAYGWDEASGMNRLEIFLDDADITEAFISEPDSSQGIPGIRTIFPIVGGPGEHRLRARAVDNAGLWTEAEIRYTLSQTALVRNVAAFPSPASGPTRVTAELSRPGQMIISLYTTGGRFIRRLQGEALYPGRAGLEWDLLDQDGDRVANGVYLVSFKLQTDEASTEALGKLVVMR